MDKIESKRVLNPKVLLHYIIIVHFVLALILSALIRMEKVPRTKTKQHHPPNTYSNVKPIMVNHGMCSGRQILVQMESNFSEGKTPDEALQSESRPGLSENGAWV